MAFAVPWRVNLEGHRIWDLDIIMYGLQYGVNFFRIPNRINL